MSIAHVVTRDHWGRHWWIGCGVGDTPEAAHRAALRVAAHPYDIGPWNLIRGGAA